LLLRQLYVILGADGRPRVECSTLARSVHHFTLGRGGGCWWAAWLDCDPSDGSARIHGAARWQDRGRGEATPRRNKPGRRLRFHRSGAPLPPWRRFNDCTQISRQASNPAQRQRAAACARMHSVAWERARTVVGLLGSVADGMNNPNPLTDLIRIIRRSGLPVPLGLDPCPAAGYEGLLFLRLEPLGCADPSGYQQQQLRIVGLLSFLVNR
jgi:hypothetical protein